VKNRFRLAHEPKFTEHHDIDTWHKLEKYLNKQGDAIFLDLVIRCSTHDHPSGGEGFVKYCIRNGWLVKLDLDENRYKPWRAIEGNRVVEDSDITENLGIL
jgi:hypothetical protein